MAEGRSHLTPVRTTRTPEKVLIHRHSSPTDLRGAVSYQDFDKQSTATRPISKARSMRGGKR
jgi:hypothetical protein